MDQFSKNGRLVILRADVRLGHSPPAEATCRGQTLTFAQLLPRCWSSLDPQEQYGFGIYETAIA